MNSQCPLLATSPREVLNETYKCLAFIEKQGIPSADPFDIKAKPLVGWTLRKPSLLRRTVRGVIYGVAALAPKAIRRAWRIKPVVTSEGIAVLADTYREIFELTGEERYLVKSLDLVQWLFEHQAVAPTGTGWGLPFTWYSYEIVPADTANAHTTAVCADILMNFVPYLGENTIVGVIKEVIKFLTEGLFRTYESEQKACFSYTPFDRSCVINTNVDIALVLLRAHSMFSFSNQIKILGEKLIRLAIDDQQQDGAWGYVASFGGPPTDIDNYHTGMILRALARTSSFVEGDLGQRLARSLQKGVDFYMSQLFDQSGAPKFSPHKKYPVDIFSCAQALLTIPELLGNESVVARHRDLHVLLQKVLSFTVNRMKRPSGEFYYRDYHWIRLRLGSLRWAQAPTCLGLLRSLKVLRETDLPEAKNAA